MQSAPTSAELMAETYRQTLLADAARTRPKTPRQPRRSRSLVSIAVWRNRAGAVMIWAGERLRESRRGTAGRSVDRRTL